MWDDESWSPPPAPPWSPLPRLEAPLEAELAPRVRPLEAELVTATPAPRVRAVEGVPLDDAWARRLERWREVRELLDRLPAESWPRTAPAWGLEGDVRAPIEAGGASWSPVAGGVRAAVAATRPRRVVLRGGRRAGKSSTMCELAVADATSGTWAISAGDVGLPDRLVSLARLVQEKAPAVSDRGSVPRAPTSGGSRLARLAGQSYAATP